MGFSGPVILCVGGGHARVALEGLIRAPGFLGFPIGNPGILASLGPFRGIKAFFKDSVRGKFYGLFVLFEGLILVRFFFVIKALFSLESSGA